MRGFLKYSTLFFCLIAFHSGEATVSHELPVPDGMRMRMQFWVDVFTKYSQHQAVLHDVDRPERIYQVVDMSRLGNTREEQVKKIREERNRIARLLLALSKESSREREFTSEESRLIHLFGKNPSPAQLRQASQNVRIQIGMREAFRDGITASGRYMPYIKQVFRERGLPEDLAYLPHVESSFNPKARSCAGAVGVWQFTSSTGRSYMRINPDIDERKDPYIATVGAAELLADNYEALGSWPLAITAYNHGVNGMKRAQKQCGTSDLDVIVQNYRSKFFGFASKNFYTEFLAAVHVARHADDYFDDISMESPLLFKTETLKANQSLKEVCKAHQVDEKEFCYFNPALGAAIQKGKRPLPAGYTIRLPLMKKIESQENSLRFPEFAAASLDSMGLIRHSTPSIKTNASVQERLVAFSDSSQAESIIYALLDNAPAIVDTSEASIYTPDLSIHHSRIIVQPEETLGHLSDWLEVSTWTLRRINKMQYHQPLKIGQSVLLTFEYCSKETFLERRQQFHETHRQEFFSKNKITDKKEHIIRPGETLWKVAALEDTVPLWLIVACNPESLSQKLLPGDVLRIPVVERL